MLSFILVSVGGAAASVILWCSSAVQTVCLALCFYVLGVSVLPERMKVPPFHVPGATLNEW